MKKLFILALIALNLVPAMAQKGKKERKLERIIFKDASAETPEVTVTITNIVSTDEYVKFKAKVVNKTNDYVIWQINESSFTIEGQELKPSEKAMLLAPNDDGVRIIDIKTTIALVKNFSVKLEGFYRISSMGSKVDAPDFKLPPSANDFQAGPFHVVMLANSRKSDLTVVKFEVTYQGNRVGLFNPSKTAIKMPTGSEWANMKLGRKGMILERGNSDKFELAWREIPVKEGDMQFVQMSVLWHDAFSESDSKKVTGTKADIEWDEALTTK